MGADPTEAHPSAMWEEGFALCLSMSWRLPGGVKQCLGEGSGLCWVLPARAFPLGDAVERLNPLPGGLGAALLHIPCRIDQKLWEPWTPGTQGWSCPSPSQC